MGNGKSAMKLHLNQSSGNVINGGGDGFVVVNRRRYEKSLIVSPDRLLEDWTPQNADQLSDEVMQALADWCRTTGADCILLGAGRRFIAPQPRWQAHFIAQKKSLETMTTIAACRTYGILQGDGRAVVAALIID